MGKNLIQQARGRGTTTYRAPSFRWAGKVGMPPITSETLVGEIMEIVDSQGHSAPLILIKYSNGAVTLQPAPEGVRVGDQIEMGDNVEVKIGNILPLKSIPDGTLINNIEIHAGDGGKMVRSSGTSGRILTKMHGEVIVELPSKKQKAFNENARAIIGVLAGGGRTEKPLYKAGHMWWKMQAKNKKYPSVSGNAQNAVDHPFGNKRSLRKSKARPVSRNAPPGRKVGMIAARRTGRKK